MAFPYTMPDFIPSILVELVNNLSLPSPIQTTVKRTMAEFRRTHQDTWHEDVLKFTSDQLEIVSEVLVSPSYYA